MNNWNITKSKKLYNINHWGEGYFDINERGDIVVSPTLGKTSINLYKLTQYLKEQGFSFPILVRFPNTLIHRVDSLYNAFNAAMHKYNYHANYTPVYPIKVNQQKQVIKAILTTGQAGLEVGSKAELMAALALISKGNTIICNGYKDREYIQLALIGQKMGIHTCLIIEKLSDFKLIFEEIGHLKIRPNLGVRIKLAAIAKGKWQDSGGNKSKFGLNSAQVLAIVSHIKKAGFINSLQLLHFHIGSQIADIYDIQKALCEAARYYGELHALGVPIHTIDVGGGLGIDYEGMQSSNPCSVNYNVQEYANNIIYEFSEICKKLDLPKPNIITEAGRFLTAHHAVLVTNIIDVEPAFDTDKIQTATINDPDVIQNLWTQLSNTHQYSALESYHNAKYWLNEIHSLFSHGVITLKQRAHAEQLYYAICLKVKKLLQKKKNNIAFREIIDEINTKLVDKYFTNFSLFQSAPDAWAIAQLFPIMPLHRLNEYPNRRATLQDLTCDSDGQFKKYVSNEWVDTSLPVHTLIPNEPYLIGIFLVGAYQEILGDIHNLFGKPNSVSVYITESGHYKLINKKKGDTVNKILKHVDFNADELLSNYNESLHENGLTIKEKHLYLKILKSSLESSTYLEI
jgi:arginine decarboxylase